MNFLKKILGIPPKKGITTYRRGIQYFNRLEFDKAIDAFEQILSEKGLAHSLEANLTKFYCGRAYLNVGVTQFAKDRSDKALGYFQKALEFNPQDTDLHYFIGICLNNVGRYQDAMSSFSKILETEPWNVPTKLKIAIIFHNMKMWKNAEEIHRAILRKHPEFADVHYHLGLSLMSQNKPKEASHSFSTALNINPNYTQARQKLAIVHICLGQINKAEENLTLIVNRHPDYADVHYLLALVKEKKNDLTGALYHLNQALAISPQFKNALVKKIIIHCKSGDQKAAHTQIEKAFTHYPHDKRITTIQKAIKVFSPVSRLLESQHTAINVEDENLIKELKNEFHKDLDIMPNVSEIISIFNNSQYMENGSNFTEFLVPFIVEQINRNPTYPDLYNSLGVRLKLCEKMDEAEEAFRKAVELNPDYVTARINLLKILQENKKYEAALSHGQYLVERNLPFPDLYFTFSIVLFELKRYDLSLTNAKRALKLSNSMGKIHFLIARIYEALGKHEDAAQSLKSLLKEETNPKLVQEARLLLQKLDKTTNL